MIPFGAAHTFMAYIWEYLPLPPGKNLPPWAGLEVGQVCDGRVLVTARKETEWQLVKMEVVRLKCRLYLNFWQSSITFLYVSNNQWPREAGAEWVREPRQAADEFAPRLSRSQPDLRPSWPMAHPTGSTRGFGDLLSSSSPLGLNSSAREELERVKKRRGGRGTGAGEFSQKMKRRACGQATTLAKIMWDTLAECKASTIDHLTWKQTFFGPSSTFPPPPPPPPPPHAMLLLRKGLPKSRPILHRGGGGSEYSRNSAKKAKCPTHFGQDCWCWGHKLPGPSPLRHINRAPARGEPWVSLKPFDPDHLESFGQCFAGFLCAVEFVHVWNEGLLRQSYVNPAHGIHGSGSRL